MTVPRPVVICPVCRHDINSVFTCVPNDDTYVFGSEAGFERPPASDIECRDCAVTIGGTHHIFCCVAQCRTCTEHPDPADEDPSPQRLFCRHWETQLLELGIDL